MAAGPLTIGIWPGLQRTALWQAARPMLQAAADRGDGRIDLDGRHIWAITDGGCLVACATTRTTLDGHAEVELVGGGRVREWLADLSAIICRWASDEGMRSVRAYGRPGWRRILDWDVLGVEDGSVVYEKRLGYGARTDHLPRARSDFLQPAVEV